MGDLVLLDHLQHSGFVAEINFFKSVLRAFAHARQVCQMTGIGQAIEVDQLRNLRLINDVLDEVGADKAPRRL